MVVANYEFSSIMEVAEYMTALQRNSLVTGVEVKGITRVQKKLTPAGPAKANKTTLQQKADNSNSMDKPQTPAADKANVPPVEEIVKLMEQGIVPPANEGDKLLNQLTWMVNEQLVKEKYGIDIKDAAALEELKKKYSAKEAVTPANADRPDRGKPASTTGAAVVASPAVTPKAADPANEIAVYQVSMNIALKPLTQAK